MALDSRPTATVMPTTIPIAWAMVSARSCSEAVKSKEIVAAKYPPSTTIPNVTGQRTDRIMRESRSVGVHWVNLTMRGKTSLWTMKAVTTAIRTITAAVAGSNHSGSPSPKRASMGSTKMVSKGKSAGESATGE